jgi:hypothetical protein
MNCANCFWMTLFRHTTTSGIVFATVLLSLLLPIAKASSALLFVPAPGKRTKITRLDTRRNSSPGDPEWTASSVGDYVKGVHGGKYQFGVAGFNHAPHVEIRDDDDDTAMNATMLPRWATRLGTDCAQRRRAAVDRLVPPCTVIVQNQERTWEPFHVKIVRVLDDDSVVEVQAEEGGRFTVWPVRGKLAPKGGALNPYKPTEPYLDSAQVHVLVRADDDRSNYYSYECEYFLVIGTEEEQWFYRLSVR